MNQCPNCGAVVADGAKFCPNCGAAQPSAPPRTVPGQAVSSGPILNGQPAEAQAAPPEKKGRKAGIIAAIAAAAVALAAAGVLLVPRLFRSPEKEFVAYQQEAVAAPLLAFLESKVDIGGAKAQPVSTDMTLTMDTDYAELRPYLENTSLAFRVDSAKDSFLLNGELSLMGSPVLSGAATYEKGMFGFCLPELDENYYVMDADALLSRLTGQEMELGEAKQPEISGKEWAALIRAYLDIANSAITKENVTLEKRQEFTLTEVGGFCTGDVYTYRPTADDVETVLNKLAGHLEGDRDLRSLVLTLVDEETLLAALDNGYDSLDEALAEAVDYLRTNAARAGRAVEDSGFTWTLYVEDKTVRMVRWETNDSAAVWESTEDGASGAQALYAVAQGETVTVFRHDYRKSGEDRQGEVTLGAEDSQMTVSYQNKGGSRQGSIVLDNEGQVITVDYLWETEKPRASLSMTADGETVTLDCRWDEKTRSALGIPYGSYTLGVDYSYGETIDMTLEVAAAASGGTDHVLTVSTPQLGAEMSRISFNLHTTDQKSTAVRPAAAPTDITGYDQEELEALFNDLTYKLYGQFLGQVGLGQVSSVPYGT